ncbi:MAG: DUF2807 domain-containing protein [Cyclobacteriaceae bacterium]|nr:DUF2807 domain-containing protein [Cyclobacteriaceae bacterium]
MMHTLFKSKNGLFQLVLCFILIGFIAPGASGQLVKKLELGAFKAISLNSNYRVILRQSNKQEVEVKVEEDIWNATNIWVDNGVLHIDIKREDSGKKSVWAKIDNIKIRPTMDVNISVPSIDRITVNGNGMVEAENSITSDNLILEMNGSGSMDIDTRAKNVNASVYSTGEIKLSGYCDKLDLMVGGKGKFSGFEFDAKSAKIAIRGESVGEVNVAETLDAEIFGSGSILHKGNTKSVNRKIYGDGTVNRAY